MLFLSKYREAGLLVLRGAVGAFFLYLALPVVLGGASRWSHFGAPLRHFGLRSHLEWWGFASVLAQTIGSLLMLLGWFFRLGVLLILVCVALHTALVWKTERLPAIVSLEFCLVLASLLLIGPGKYGVDRA